MAVDVPVRVEVTAVDRGATAVLKSFGNVAESVHNKFSDLVNRSRAASAAFTAALTLTAKSIVDVASDMQQAKVAFDTMLGSAEEGSRVLRDLSDFAKKTPFDFPQLVEASKRLLAYNIEAENLIPTLKTLGNIAAGVGMDKLPQLILAFGQVKAATRLTGMELRQFSEAGVPLLGALADQAGVTAAVMKDKIQEGAVTFEDVQKVLSGMTTEGGKFFNLMERQSHTLGGITSNIKDQLIRVAMKIAGLSTETETFGDVMEGGPFDMLADASQRVLDALNALEPRIEGIIKAFVDNQAAIGATLGIIAGGLLGATVAMWGFISPILILMGILGAIGLGIGLVIESMGGLNGIITTAQEVWGFLVDTFNSVVLPAFEAIRTQIMEFVTANAPLFMQTWDNIVKVIGGGLIIAQNIWNAIWPAMRDVFNAVWKSIQGIVKIAWGFMELLITVGLLSLSGDWSKAWEGMAIAFKDIWEGLKEFISGMWEAIKGIFKSQINSIIGMINGFADIINRAKPGKDIAKLPTLQTGGIVPGEIGSPQLAVLHGGEKVLSSASRAGGGGIGATFNVYIGMYAGTETEKRNIAMSLWNEVMEVARSRNKSISELSMAEVS